MSILRLHTPDQSTELLGYAPLSLCHTSTCSLYILNGYMLTANTYSKTQENNMERYFLEKPHLQMEVTN